MLDPARLLRKSWSNVDELAKELYVMLKGQQEAAREVPSVQSRLPLAPGRTPVNQPFTAEAAAFRSRPIFTRQNTSPTSEPPSRPPIESEAGHRQVAALTEVAKQLGITTPIPPAAPPGLTRVDHSAGTTVNVTPPSRRADNAQFHQGATLAEGLAYQEAHPEEFPWIARDDQRNVRALRPGDISYSSDNPYRRVSSAIPVTPLEDDRIAYSLTRSQRQPLYTAPIERVQPLKPEDFGVTTFTQSPVDVTPLQVVSDPTLARKRELESTDEFYPERFPYGTGELRLAFIGPAGIPGAVKAPPTSGSSNYPTFAPGKGDGVFFDFDDQNNSLGYQTDSNVQFWNYSQLPVSGNQLVPVVLMLGYFWVQPPDWCHGKIGVQTVPCTTDVPDTTGFVQTMYMSNGQMIFDQNIPLESWYNVTAKVGRHCSVRLVDGLISLEVLDCDP